MNWIDTPLLVYNALADHPANSTIEQLLHEGMWASSVLILIEVDHVLTRYYGVSDADAVTAIDNLARSPIRWTPLELGPAARACIERKAHRIEAADTTLLALARTDEGVVVSNARRLLSTAESLGIPHRNPITPDLVAEIERWEAMRLATKGLPRILRTVESWIRRQNVTLAEQFHEATGQLTRLPY